MYIQEIDIKRWLITIFIQLIIAFLTQWKLLNEVKMDENIGYFLEKEDVFFWVIIPDDWIFFLVGQDTDKTETINIPFFDELYFICFILYLFDKLTILDYFVHLLRTQFNYRDVICFLELLNHRIE